MLTQALAGEPIVAPALVGADLATAAIWLRERAAGVLSEALRPHELLDLITMIFESEHPALPEQDARSRVGTTWQYAAALEVATAELAGNGRQADPITVANLTLDPDGMLTALAELTAHLFRLHDGPGARAVVRALRP